MITTIPTNIPEWLALEKDCGLNVPGNAADSVRALLWLNSISRYYISCRPFASFPCLYAWENKRGWYVGKTKCLSSRIYQHEQKHGAIRSVSFIGVPEAAHRTILEKALIVILQPELNDTRHTDAMWPDSLMTAIASQEPPFFEDTFMLFRCAFWALSFGDRAPLRELSGHAGHFLADKVCEKRSANELGIEFDEQALATKHLRSLPPQLKRGFSQEALA